ncbi:uncharacterized protein LOC143861962 [Tasmannia lanceolata]|uniref:uncharacterized protein LOC143861962 n=1 Tax=Tasmannia lanceolata TaxID=3420 RepID=UPI004064C171
MNKSQNPPPPIGRGRGGGRTNLASCIVATIFLIFVVIVILIVYFSVFKPKDPNISVNSIQLPSFSVTNGTVTFTFSQYVSVRNPNREAFSHYDSTLQLIYSQNPIGFMFIPAGKIDSGRTQYMSATFSVDSFPFSPTQAPATGLYRPAYGSGGIHVGPSLEIESTLRMEGRVRVLHFFTHHVESTAECRVAISVTDGSVLEFHC